MRPPVKDRRRMLVPPERERRGGYCRPSPPPSVKR